MQPRGFQVRPRFASRFDCASVGFLLCSAYDPPILVTLMRSGAATAGLAALSAALGLLMASRSYAAEASSPSPPLTRVAQVRSLTPTEVARGWRVELTGVITFSDPNRQLLCLQDATGGLFVFPQTRGWDYRVGQEMKVTGEVAPGEHLPCVSQAVLQPLGLAALPVPRAVTADHLATDVEDANWVEVHGVVRTVSLRNGRLSLEIVTAGRRLQALFAEPPSARQALTGLVDAEVRLQGVCGMVFRDPASPVLLSLHVPSLAYLAVEVKAPEQPFLAPLRPIGLLRLSSRSPGEVHRLRVQGTLSSATNGVWRLTDPTGEIQVSPPPMPPPGSNQLVEVLGFPGGSPAVPVLEDATVLPLALCWPESFASPTNAPPEYLPVLTQVQAIRELPPAEAHRGYPVRLRGVITCADRAWGMLFVQDDTAGIYLYEDPPAFAGHAGQVVQVEGFTGAGKFAPIVRQPRLLILGQDRLPWAQPVTLDQLHSGHEDGQFVEVQGIVRYLTVQNGHLTLDLNTSGGLLKAFVPGFETNRAPLQLLDAEVVVQAVCGTVFNKERQLTGVQLFPADMESIRVTKPAPADPFALPLRPLGSLFQFQNQPDLRHRLRVRGTVTFRDPRWYTLFIQHETNHLYVRTLVEPKLDLGDLVDVVGFATPGRFGPEMSEAVFRRVGPGTPPAPIPVTVAQACSGEFDSHLVTVNAILVDRMRGSGGLGLVLQGAQWTFVAVLESSQNPRALAALREGSRLRLTGICCLQAADNQVGTTLCLNLRSPADIVVLERPPWWTPRRRLAALGFGSLILAATASWVVLLRRNVRAQTAVIRQKLEREAALEAQYRDLFDNVNDLIQSLNPDGSIALVNPAWLKALGYSPSEVASLSICDLLHPEDWPHWTAVLERIAAGESSVLLQARFRRRDGQLLELEGICGAGRKEGQHPAIRGVFRDVTQRNRAEKAQRASLEEKTALLKEVHHRVKNNLQIVISLLNLQAARLKQPELLDPLRDTQNRVRSMALVHEVLYRSENLARLSIADHVESLCEHLLASFGPAVAARIQLQRRVANLNVSLDQAVPCGLIINELVSNALKHAFPDGRSGHILVELRADSPAQAVLTISDSGIGLPPGLDITRTQTLGVRIVSNLATQLKGTLAVQAHGPTGGALFRLIFPTLDDVRPTPA